MKTYYKLLFILTFSFASNACKKSVFKDDNLSLHKQPFNGNTMRTDGYYYMKYGNPELVDIYFFYRNGIAMYGETPSATELETHEEKFRDGTYYNLIKDKKYYWGLFVVEDSIVKYELWSAANLYYKAFLHIGRIVNDTTLHITQTERSNGEDLKSVDWWYHFKPFAPKTDSTNNFID